MRRLALERFPAQRKVLVVFFDELARRVPGSPSTAGEAAGSFEALLENLEDLLEALLAGEARGITQR